MNDTMLVIEITTAVYAVMGFIGHLVDLEELSFGFLSIKALLTLCISPVLVALAGIQF